MTNRATRTRVRCRYRCRQKLPSSHQGKKSSFEPNFFSGLLGNRKNAVDASTAFHTRGIRSDGVDAQASSYPALVGIDSNGIMSGGCCMTAYLAELFAWIKANPGATATISAAIIAVCGVVFSAFSAFVTGRRSVYISSVTAERSKWIEKLRSNIAELLQVCAAINNETQRTHGYDDWRNRADGLISLISLQLNPADEDGIDKNLIAHLRILVKATTKSPDEFRKEEEKFVRHSQFMLKEEWEKVKSEARGSISKIWHKIRGRKCARRCAYKRFVREELPWASMNK